MQPPILANLRAHISAMFQTHAPPVTEISHYNCITTDQTSIQEIAARNHAAPLGPLFGVVCSGLQPEIAWG